MKLIGGPLDGEDYDLRHGSRMVFPERHCLIPNGYALACGTYYREVVYERQGDSLNFSHNTEWRWADIDDERNLRGDTSRAYPKPGPEYDEWADNWRREQKRIEP